MTCQPSQASSPPTTRSRRATPERKFREALAAYQLDLPTLRHIAAHGGNLRDVIANHGELPAELSALLDTWDVLMRPAPREQIKSPQDVAALMMVQMGHLDQEELRCVCLDTKNRVQRIATIYKGSLNSACIRVGEVFKPALQLNSAAIIVVHQHPSGDPTPSPEDVLVTRQIVDAGKLLDLEVLDHIVVGHGRFVSMKERGLGFPK